MFPVGYRAPSADSEAAPIIFKSDSRDSSGVGVVSFNGPAHDFANEREQLARTRSNYDNIKTRCRKGPYYLDTAWASFDQFLADMGRRPTRQHTIDRIDPQDPTYGPGRCRWATKEAQTKNRRNTINLTDDLGVCRPLSEWAEITGQKYDTMLKRKTRQGWTDQEVIDGKRKSATTAEIAAHLPYPCLEPEGKLLWEDHYIAHGRPGQARLAFMKAEVEWKLAALHEDNYPGPNDCGCDDCAYCLDYEIEAAQYPASPDTLVQIETWSATLSRVDAAIAEEQRARDVRLDLEAYVKRCAKVGYRKSDAVALFARVRGHDLSWLHDLLDKRDRHFGCVRPKNEVVRSGNDGAETEAGPSWTEEEHEDWCQYNESHGE